MRLFCGVDIGKLGAIVILDEKGNVVFKSVVPTIGKEYDKTEMFSILLQHSDHIIHTVFEDVHATHMGGNTSSFEFGRGKGLWEMALIAANIPHTAVQPKKWQTIWEGTQKQYLPTSKRNKKGEIVQKIDTKATSLLCAKRLFPNVDFRESSRCKVAHNGIVDALLMSEYCRRTFK